MDRRADTGVVLVDERGPSISVMLWRLLDWLLCGVFFTLFCKLLSSLAGCRVVPCLFWRTNLAVCVLHRHFSAVRAAHRAAEGGLSLDLSLDQIWVCLAVPHEQPMLHALCSRVCDWDAAT